jgi:ABC-2 type transport system permease protein
LDEPTSEPRTIALAEIPAKRRFYWLLRRELWESRSIYLAPLAVAGLIVFASLIGAFHLPEKLREAHGLAKQQEVVAQPYFFAALMLMAVTFIVGVFYSIDALQTERRDRSILFWKSMPVSDLETVLAKASIPIVVLPLLTVVVAMVTQLAMLVVGSVVVAASGGSAATLWGHVSLPGMWLMLAYHMVTVHSLLYAPIYAWLLLVSAWSRRVPWLWAILPPLAIGIFERIAFGTSHFANMLGNSMGGGAEGSDFSAAGGMMDPLMQMTPGRFVSSPGLWVGLALAAAFLAAAVRLRRLRGPV